MKSNETKKEQEVAVLFGLSLNNKDDGLSSLNELERLAETAGIMVSGRLFQNAKEITPATFIGSGKVLELKELVENTGVNLAICDNELTGSQTMNISDIIGIKVIDRTTLILDIFAKRATTNEGKLQVELAMLKYYLPRLSGIIGTSGRFGSGGVGMRGPGETKLELDRRIIKDKILKLENQIDKIKANRDVQRQNRIQSKVKRVSIIGYTNAGKSTLMNLITKADIYADDKLFATLDTTTRNVWLGENKQIVLTDTVGFINKLSHSFVDAFSATLTELKDSDLIIHLVDITDKDRKMHEQVVVDELKKLGVDKISLLTVYNKVDLLNSEEKLRLKNSNEVQSNSIFISARKNENIENLKNAIIKKLWE